MTSPSWARNPTSWQHLRGLCFLRLLFWQLVRISTNNLFINSFRLSWSAFCSTLLSGLDGHGLWLNSILLEVSPPSLWGIFRSGFCGSLINRPLRVVSPVFESKVLRMILGAVKINDTRRRRNYSELMNLYEDVNILSSVRLSKLKWIGHVNRMDKERKVYNIL